MNWNIHDSRLMPTIERDSYVEFIPHFPYKPNGKFSKLYLINHLLICTFKFLVKQKMEKIEQLLVGSSGLINEM